ncbi:adenosine kinase 2 [Drosophila eugracilis]|uniref:adenosine kinase 2 n=1 Tax=Drosophila eugracilis TaxID=29029 RepID=UPI001BDA8C76|nr:adenosine kinase 2 [Drosophila eugracilis]
MTVRILGLSIKYFPLLRGISIHPYLQSPKAGYRSFCDGKETRRMELPEGIIMGFGNPLLDITCNVEDNVLLEKYGLEPNAAIIADEKHDALFDELMNMENVTYSAGGACQNSMRVFQWIVQTPFRAVFTGAVGKDKLGDRIEKRATANGLLTLYQVKEELPTGSCAVIINGPNRSLVANLGAASLYSEDWLDDEENACALERAAYFYITGFFLAVCSPVVERVAIMCSESNRIMILNFSAVFVLQMQKDALANILQYVDIIICNKEEAIAFSETTDWKTKDVFAIGSQLQKMPKANVRPRIVMITDSACPVLVFQDNDRILEYPVPPVKRGEVFDTNGCGDAFVGGFLAMYVQRMPLDYCIRTGIFASQQILNVVGVQIEKLPKFSEACI